MKAIGSKIIVKVNEENSVQEKNGLFLQSGDISTHDMAVVVSVGEEIKADLKEGDTVLIYKGVGHEINVEDEKLKVISISEIIAKWEN